QNNSQSLPLRRSPRPHRPQRRLQPSTRFLHRPPRRRHHRQKTVALNNPQMARHAAGERSYAPNTAPSFFPSSAHATPIITPMNTIVTTPSAQAFRTLAGPLMSVPSTYIILVIG